MIKRILPCTLAILLMLGMVGCSSNNKDNSSKQIEEQTTEDNSSVDFEKEYGIKNEDMQELFESVKENMFTYFKENNIDSSTYSWPDKNDNDKWKVYSYYKNFCTSEDTDVNKYDEKTIEFLESIDRLSSEDAKIMQQAGRAFIYWIDKHPEYKNQEVKRLPWNEILPENISFNS